MLYVALCFKWQSYFISNWPLGKSWPGSKKNFKFNLLVLWPYRIDVLIGSIKKILWGVILKHRPIRPNLLCVLLSSLSSSSLRCIFIFAYTQMDLDNKTRGRKKCLFIYALGSTVPSYKSMRATQAWYLFCAVSLVSNLVSIIIKSI